MWIVLVPSRVSQLRSRIVTISVTGAYVFGNAAHLHQISEDIDGVSRPDTAGDTGRQAFMCELVDDHHQFDRSTIIGAMKNEIPGLDVVLSFGPEPDTGAVRSAIAGLASVASAAPSVLHGAGSA